MFWHAPISADELTPAQTNLISIGDWMVKVSVGAILGVIGGARVATANGGRDIARSNPHYPPSGTNHPSSPCSNARERLTSPA